jgi:hypothetical protein
MKKVPTIAFSCLLSVSSLLAACGSTKDDGSTAGSTTSAPASEPAVTAALVTCGDELLNCEQYQTLLVTATATQFMFTQCQNNLSQCQNKPGSGGTRQPRQRLAQTTQCQTTWTTPTRQPRQLSPQTTQCKTNLDNANAAAAVAAQQMAQCQNNLAVAQTGAAAAAAQAAAANASLACVPVVAPGRPSPTRTEDGVRNPIDTCPNTPAGQLVDSHGCPRPLMVTFRDQQPVARPATA